MDKPKKTIQVVLVSRQAIPNISPTLDKRIKPDKIILVVTQDMLNVAKQLEQIYHPNGIKTERWQLVDAWDIKHIQNRMSKLLHQCKDDIVQLNATGGTKPMSIAAYEIFRAEKRPIFYIHPEKDHLIWMYPSDQMPIDLEDRIKIKDYFKAYGAIEVNYESYGVKSQIRQLNEALIADINQFKSVMPTFNYLASKAEKNRLQSPDLTREHKKDKNLIKLISLFQQAGLISYKENRLHYTDEDSRFICNGGWLEHYTHSCGLNIKKQQQLQDIKRSVTIKTGSTTNELDVVLLKDNRAYIIECKTQQNKSDKLKNTLYKLDSVSDTLGGLQCQALLVNYYPLKAHEVKRARQHQIHHCSYTQLKDLEKILIQWLQ